MFSTVQLLLNKVEMGKSELSLGEVISMDVFIIGCGDVKWMIILSSQGMKLLAAEGLMYDPGLIECVEFDWFSVRCLEDTSSFTSLYLIEDQSNITVFSGAVHVYNVCQMVSFAG